MENMNEIIAGILKLPLVLTIQVLTTINDLWGKVVGCLIGAIPLDSCL